MDLEGIPVILVRTALQIYILQEPNISSVINGLPLVKDKGKGSPPRMCVSLNRL